MDIVTLDWETYYDDNYSLTRMSTEDYVCDPRFQIMMVGIQVNDGDPEWVSFRSLAEYKTYLEPILRGNAVLCHNTMFDGLILAVHFGIYPKLYLDTLAMAQALLKPKYRSISLASCLKNEELEVEKGTYVGNMKGRRLESLTQEELNKYGQYCVDDCIGEYVLFKHLVKDFPRDELKIIDMTLRMYLQPQLVPCYDTFKNVYDDTRAKKAELVSKLPEGVTKSQLTSNAQLAKLLESYDVEVPLKISPTTNKPTYAFAKNDEGWKDLEEMYADDPEIAPILAARLGVKSSIAESRAERMMGIAGKYPWLRIPLRYYAALTGRYGGMEKINAQNFTRVDYKNPSRNQLRFGIKAPDGHSVLAGDLSQIEVRVNAWLSGCKPLLSVFARGGDPYCEFATKAFGRTITKDDSRERFIGKTCILGLGYGMGWKKLRATLRKDGVKISEQEAQDFVNVYRTEYPEIPALWRYCDNTIELIANGGQRLIGPCRAEHQAILMPNDMRIQYNNLRMVQSKKYSGWVYDYAGMGRTLWGGKVVENLCQSLARIIISGHMLAIKDKCKLQPALQAHDELVYVVPTQHVKVYEHHILKIMKTPPAFAPDLPIDAEADYGSTYGDAK